MSWNSILKLNNNNYTDLSGYIKLFMDKMLPKTYMNRLVYVPHANRMSLLGNGSFIIAFMSFPQNPKMGLGSEGSFQRA